METQLGHGGTVPVLLDDGLCVRHAVRAVLHPAVRHHGAERAENVGSAFRGGNPLVVGDLFSDLGCLGGPVWTTRNALAGEFCRMDYHDVDVGNNTLMFLLRDQDDNTRFFHTHNQIVISFLDLKSLQAF